MWTGSNKGIIFVELLYRAFHEFCRFKYFQDELGLFKEHIINGGAFLKWHAPNWFPSLHALRENIPNQGKILENNWRNCEIIVNSENKHKSFILTKHISEISR